ncbi:carbon-nitrogen hydrolase [bacterium]|nr:carbon-nitrogen hydrolase [bacterium]MBU1025441.1 carbon-nitrogen hydrolase [bacterium]
MKLKVGIAQFSPILGDVTRNLEKIFEFIERAREENCGLVTFPENALTGYFLRDLVSEVSEPIDGEIIKEIKAKSREIDILLGFVEESKDFNNYLSGGYFSKGKLLHVHRKVYLPTYGMFEDRRYFSHGERVRAFDTPFARMGVLICEDALHPLLSYVLAMDEILVLHVISNSPLRGFLKNESDTLEKWEETLQIISRMYGFYVVYTNRSGFEDGIHYGGNSFISDPNGAILIRAKKGEEDFISAIISLEAINRTRVRLPLVRDEIIPLSIKELQRIYKNKK